jgi:hypothetical protein
MYEDKSAWPIRCAGCLNEFTQTVRELRAKNAVRCPECGCLHTYTSEAFEDRQGKPERIRSLGQDAAPSPETLVSLSPSAHSARGRGWRTHRHLVRSSAGRVAYSSHATKATAARTVPRYIRSLRAIRGLGYTATMVAVSVSSPSCTFPATLGGCNKPRSPRQ